LAFLYHESKTGFWPPFVHMSADLDEIWQRSFVAWSRWRIYGSHVTFVVNRPTRSIVRHVLAFARCVAETVCRDGRVRAFSTGNRCGDQLRWRSPRVFVALMVARGQSLPLCLVPNRFFSFEHTYHVWLN